MNTITKEIPAEEAIRPMAGRIMIRLDPVVTHSSGVHGKALLLASDTKQEQKENYRFGTVVALGPPELHAKSARPIPWEVSVGDHVCFQFGADLDGVAEMKLTNDVPHAMCFSADVIYVIEDTCQLLPVFLNDKMLAAAFQRIFALTDTPVEPKAIARELMQMVAGGSEE